MESDYSQYVCRKPRHQALAAPGLRVQIERCSEHSSGVFEAELNNLSRNGFQLLTSLPLQVGESIIVRIHAQPSGVELALSAQVRWRTAEDAGRWVVGCQSSDQVDWETLGELFLNGVLATDAASAQQADHGAEE